MAETSLATSPTTLAPPRWRVLTRNPAGIIGLAVLLGTFAVCMGLLPWMLARIEPTPEQKAMGARIGAQRYNAGSPHFGRLPPSWWMPRDANDIRRFNELAGADLIREVAAAHNMPPDEAVRQTHGPAAEALRRHWPQRERWLTYLLGSDRLGRSMLYLCLTGGGISMSIGVAAAFISVLIGTLYGAVAGYAGGKVDAVLMRIVDILYGLPYILLVVLLAVAVDASIRNTVAGRVKEAARQREQFVQVGARAAGPTAQDEPAIRASLEEEALRRFGTGEMSAARQGFINVVVLLVAIGGVSWLTMARVVRGQVLSLKARPFMEAARAVGVGWFGQFRRHLLPNLTGPIIVYATLTVPQAILQESFLSFLGIGVKTPLPSWGNLAAEGLSELNTYKSYWWMLVFPCVLLGTTLLALNFVGEMLREAMDPRSSRGGRA